MEGSSALQREEWRHSEEFLNKTETQQHKDWMLRLKSGIWSSGWPLGLWALGTLPPLLCCPEYTTPAGVGKILSRHIAIIQHSMNPTPV